jgi:hypothetical protein
MLSRRCGLFIPALVAAGQTVVGDTSVGGVMAGSTAGALGDSERSDSPPELVDPKDRRVVPLCVAEFGTSVAHAASESTKEPAHQDNSSSWYSLGIPADSAPLDPRIDTRPALNQSWVS